MNENLINENNMRLQEYLENTSANNDREEKKYLFVSGDISGIQKYSYSINNSNYAAKILNQLNLADECKLMSTGDKFLLLLPNISSTKDKLKIIRKEIDTECIKKYFGELTISISEGVEASFNDLMQSKIELLFRKIAQDAEAARQNKLSTILNTSEDFVLSGDYRNEIDTSYSVKKIFEEISRPIKGAKYLAMFRANIDNLNYFLSLELKKGITIYKYTELSRIINDFFTSGLNNFIEADARYKDIRIVFSRGDDICVVGHWDAIITFAVNFRSEFMKVIGVENKLTVSAGITLFRFNYPIEIAMDNAQEALEMSKNNGKDSLTLFGETVKWEKLKELKKLWEKLDELLNEKDKKRKLSSHFVFGLLDYQKRYIDLSENSNYKQGNALWKSHLYYSLARREQTYLKDMLEKSITDKTLKIPVTYALYKNKGEKKNGKN
ncbi:MAG: hypothetical protein KKD38_04285 [Candidatus Delongbacteria bacterium]|nr:hypothetical protein [Candidatus Delongbacteria bacterium]MCG2760496.1 hypothetical protein [Candidatus Delongbacteria bacterium]